MKETVGTRGLILNEPFLWERGGKGRTGYSLPRRDVAAVALPENLTGEGPDFPDLSEVEVVRHYTRLSTWNYGVDSGMYPLGSCTMKYNPKTNERQAALPGFSGAHPLVPSELCQGALQLIYELEHFLAHVAGLDAVSVQPSAGAQGELTAMLMFAAYFRKKGEKRTKILIPDTAHGTNPATASLAGYDVVPIASEGVLTLEEVEAHMDDDVAALMVTNPNTLGLFETNIEAICQLVHERGGKVYCDGANFNAIVGKVRPGDLGVDAMHINLHKTFSTPHGGGGPGAGPVGVSKRLEPFLPVPIVGHDGDEYYWVTEETRPQSIGRLSAFMGNAGVLLRAYVYMRMVGRDGMKRLAEYATLNANYLLARLSRAGFQPAFQHRRERRGVAAALWDAGLEIAAAAGAMSMYVSATPSGSAGATAPARRCVTTPGGSAPGAGRSRKRPTMSSSSVPAAMASPPPITWARTTGSGMSRSWRRAGWAAATRAGTRRSSGPTTSMTKARGCSITRWTCGRTSAKS